MKPGRRRDAQGNPAATAFTQRMMAIPYAELERILEVIAGAGGEVTTDPVGAAGLTAAVSAAAARSARSVSIWRSWSRRRRPAVCQTAVLCSFRDLTNPQPLRNFSPEHAYAYRWGLSVPPSVGQWAVVEGADGPTTVIVGAVGANAYVNEFGVDSLEVIVRLVPAADVAKARAVVERKRSGDLAAEATWLAHCRWIAGMDPERPSRPLPAAFDVPLLPTDKADCASADRTQQSRSSA
ncbi:hypothetical protein M8542_41010 [Amycolatopsis sp. OK19-0408]|uniref:Uncharacterized protein n=1 Tax=Amycolatopsis iheyensis TaxID=2945988 RepID=A0A9X2SPZ4_9PSEU|nr:hypothetical protein [Amycolatopsis iheyensis]MCR6489218.1 hypothetical protein [Amycolatopsis iheyensis]